jgi:hypothetical protein
MRDIALQTIQDIVAALIKMQIEKMFFNLLGGAAGGLGGGLGSFGGAMPLTGSLAGGASVLSSAPISGAFSSLPGFAGGGSFNVMGRAGTDMNTLSLNGLPIAKVSYGERLSIGNDNMPRVGANMPITNNFHINGNPTRETMDQIAHRTAAAIATARRKGF